MPQIRGKGYCQTLTKPSNHFVDQVYAVKAQTSLAPLSWFHGSRVTTAHVHQCCIFQSYAKTVPSRMKLTMKLTMREPTFMGSMTTDPRDHGVHVTSDFNSVLVSKHSNPVFVVGINWYFVCLYLFRKRTCVRKLLKNLDRSLALQYLNNIWVNWLLHTWYTCCYT